MTRAVKNMLVCGKSGYAGAVLLRKILKAGYRVKAPKSFIFRDDMFLASTDVKSTINNLNLTELKDDFYNKQDLENITRGCDAVIYFDDLLNVDSEQPYGYSAPQVVDLISSLKVDKFIYVSNPLFLNGHTRKHPAYRSSDDVSHIDVCVPFDFKKDAKQKMRVDIRITSKNFVDDSKITLFAEKRKGSSTEGELTTRWYAASGQNIMKMYINSIAELCLFISERPLSSLDNKLWSFVATYRIFLGRFSFMAKIFQMLRKPYLPFCGSVRFFFMSIRRIFDVFMLMLLTHFKPEQAWRFSTRKCLPPDSMRQTKPAEPKVSYDVIESRTSDIKRMREINIILRGSSFNIKKLEELDAPIFLASFWEPIITTKDVTYITGGSKNALRLSTLGKKVIFIENNWLNSNGKSFPADPFAKTAWCEKAVDDGVFSRISILEKIFGQPDRRHADWVPHAGSAIPLICALSYFADNINVYGWDFFLRSSPENMNYWQIFSKLYDFKMDVLESKRDYFESAVMNFYYGYLFSRLPNIKIHGFMGGLGKHVRLIKKIERTLYNVK